VSDADFGNVQLYEPVSGLYIVAQQGFGQEFLEYLAKVDDLQAACGRASNARRRMVIEDVETDLDFAPQRPIAAASGFCAAQSTPLFGRRESCSGCCRRTSVARSGCPTVTCGWRARDSLPAGRTW
jgi:hypothetical protein